MKSIRLATAAAVVTGLFAASSEAATTEWWNFDFDEVADMEALTNRNQASWTSTGTWDWTENDESSIADAATDEKYGRAEETGSILKLDTQGTELQWSLKDEARPEGTKTLIDADMCLVGAEDDPTGFDNGDVQAAIYLHSFTDEDNVTTNYLCVYSYDGSAEANVWVPLQGVTVEDSSWHHVQVVVDYSGTEAKVSVFVDQTQMTDENGGTSWTIANANNISPTKISSVSFKGTGAVDNFVGQVEAVSTVSYLFTGATFLDNAAIVAPDLYTAPSDPSTVGTPVEFTSDTLLYTDGDLSATLATVSIVTFDATGVATTTSYTFTYDETELDVVAPEGAPAGMFDVDSGMITVVVPTDNATAEEGVTQIQIVTFNYTSVGGGDEPIEAVEPGEGLATWDWGTDDPKAPVEVVPAAGADPETFVIRFVGQAGVTYQLIAVDSLDDDWDTDAEPVGTAVTPTAIGIVELSAPMTEDAQFFKIKATK